MDIAVKCSKKFISAHKFKIFIPVVVVVEMVVVVGLVQVVVTLMIGASVTLVVWFVAAVFDTSSKTIKNKPTNGV